MHHWDVPPAVIEQFGQLRVVPAPLRTARVGGVTLRCYLSRQRCSSATQGHTIGNFIRACWDLLVPWHDNSLNAIDLLCMLLWCMFDWVCKMLRCTWKLLTLYFGLLSVLFLSRKIHQDFGVCLRLFSTLQQEAFGSHCFVRCDIFRSSFLVKSMHDRFLEGKEFNLTFSLVSLFFDKYSK